MPEPVTSTSKTLVFIDASVTDASALMARLPDDAEVIRLLEDADARVQIATALAHWVGQRLYNKSACSPRAACASSYI